MAFNNIAGFKDQKDKDGRTYREVNNATTHKFNVGQLVQVDDDLITLFITKQSRDCDGTPLYSLGHNGKSFLHGYAEAYLKAV